MIVHQKDIPVAPKEVLIDGSGIELAPERYEMFRHTRLLVELCRMGQ